MKHAIKLSTVILASIFAVVACEKEKAPEADYQPGETITITATLPSVPATDPATKVDFTQGTNKVDLAWSTSDKLTIIGEDTDEAQTFTLSGVSGSKANFTGTAVTGSSFTVLYPGTVTSLAAMDSKSFVGQTQTGDANLAHLTGAWTAKITGLSDFSDVKFAAPAGGTFAQSGILKFHIQVPDVVTTVKGVGIEAPSAVFYTDNNATKAASLDLTLSGVTLDAKHAFTAYMALSQKNSEDVAAGEKVKVKFTDSYDNVWEKEITLTTSFVLQAGKVNVITLDKSAWSSTGRYAGGTGVDGDPWLITEPIHMHHIAADLVSGETKYFKMMADVDMSGESWTPLNNADPYDKVISFDGNRKAVSNLSNPLFYDLNGTVENLTISNAAITISGSGSNFGILGRQIGVGATVQGVTLSDCTLNLSPSATCAGGLVGDITAGAGTVNISKCRVEGGSIYAVHYAGGLIGRNLSTAGTITISDCYTTCSSIGVKGRFVGGIVGTHEGASTMSITNCYSTSPINAGSMGSGGGIIGYIAAEGFSAVRCMAFNSSISATASGNRFSCGAIIGMGKDKDVVVNYCYRTSGMEFDCKIAENTALEDMDFITSAGRIPQTGSANPYAFCHHGLATTQTLSALVQDATKVGTAWSSTIWDFSGTEPTLKL